MTMFGKDRLLKKHHSNKMAAEQEGSEIDVGGDSLLDVDGGDDESTTTTLKKKRKRSEPRDPNAPKRPCSAYIYFSTETRLKMREETGDTSMTMAERSKHIGKMWSTLPLEQKKKYQAMADKDKQRYLQEYVKYQETDMYKAYMRQRHPSLKKTREEKRKADKRKEKERSKAAAATEKSGKAAAKLPLSCQQQFIPGSNIPIFSEEFLEHNKDLETQLRKLRQSSATLEEENALLSRHVDSMKAAVERVQNEVLRQEQKNKQTQAQLDTVREVLVDAFKGVLLPGTNESPSVGNVDGYISKLQETVTSKPDMHPALVAKVGSITKNVEKMLKEKLARGIIVSILEKNKERMLKEEEEGKTEAAMPTS